MLYNDFIRVASTCIC